MRGSSAAAAAAERNKNRRRGNFIGARRITPSSDALHISSFFGLAADEFAISVGPTPAPVCWTLPSRHDTSAGLSNTHHPVTCCLHGSFGLPHRFGEQRPSA